MKVSSIIEEIIATVTMEPCEFTLTYNYFVVYKGGTKQSVIIAEITPNEVRFINIDSGLTPEQITKIHRLWRLIDWKEVQELQNYINCVLKQFRVSTIILDKINMAKRAMTKSGLIEWKQFAALKEDYDY